MREAGARLASADGDDRETSIAFEVAGGVALDQEPGQLGLVLVEAGFGSDAEASGVRPPARKAPPTAFGALAGYRGAVDAPALAHRAPPG